jgi:hypothetical protein
MRYSIFFCRWRFYIHSGLVIYVTQFIAVIRFLISAVKAVCVTAVSIVIYVPVGAAVCVLVRAVKCSSWPLMDVLFNASYCTTYVLVSAGQYMFLLLL